MFRRMAVVLGVFALLVATVACQPRSAVVMATPFNVHPTLIPFPEGAVGIQFPTNGAVVKGGFTIRWEDWSPLVEGEHYKVVITSTEYDDCLLQRSFWGEREWTISEYIVLSEECGEVFSLQVFRMRTFGEIEYASLRQLFVWER